MDRLTEKVLAQVRRLSDDSKYMTLAYAYELRMEEEDQQRRKKKRARERKKRKTIAEENGKIIHFML